MSKRFSFKSRLAAVLVCVFACAPTLLAQSSGAPASVAGRVREGERGVPGVTVALLSNDPSQRFRTAARTRTDADGRFLLTNVAPGRYQILPFAPTYVVAGLTNNYPPGRPLTLLAGEEVKDINFTVEPGGVITGRVTDADGNPVVAESVAVMSAEDNPQQPRPQRFNFDQRDQTTDDRGVYRIYGLPPGRYRVAVGRADETGTVSFGRRKVFRRTFYPDATDEAQARIVEVKQGLEATDVDITVGRALKTYRAFGRFVSADTGQPVPNISFAYGALDQRGRRLGVYGSGQQTDARGEFVSEGLTPGRYAIFAMSTSQEGTEFYSDYVTFEIADADVKGLVVKVRQGASVSGVITVEGVSDRAAIARMLSDVRVFAFGETGRQQQVMPAGPMHPVNVGADGTFRLSGLRPGKIRVGASADATKGLTTTRIELNGASVLQGFEVADGAQVTGLHIVLAYGTGVVVGQTSFANGTLSPDARLMAQARRVAAPAGEYGRSVEVDARGFFRIEGLAAGEYTISVYVFGGGRVFHSEPQRISVGDGGEVRIAPVIDFARPSGGRTP